jgi:hypothetical protein
LGIVQNRREAEKERRRSDQDFDIASRRRGEDFARAQADESQAFAAQRAQRLADYEKRLTEMKEQDTEEAAERKTEHEARIAKLEATNKKETDEIYLHRDQRLAQLGLDLDAEEKAITDHYTQRRIAQGEGTAAELEQWRQYLIDRQAEFEAYKKRLEYGGVDPNASGSPDERASGGYAGPGVYKLGERGQREFVLSGPTTRAAERIMGPLDQQSILAAMQGSRVSNSIGNVNFSGMGASDRAWFRSAMREEFTTLFKEATRPRR